MVNQSTDSYKGVRDFYPEDCFYRDYILNTLARTAQSFGYEEYDASILEPAELYRGKTSDEILSKQAYMFTDRGEREVILRPEMTPTVARLVAHRRTTLGYPLRLFSNPNCFRYEQPQRGRLREFWQFNADMFGLSGIDADAEIVALGHACVRAFGATEKDFVIHVNDRRALNAIWDANNLSEDERKKVMHLLDAKAKMDPAEFSKQLTDAIGQRAANVMQGIETIAEYPTLAALMKTLAAMGITNVRVDTELVRGFDYYTGVIMEAFDTDPINRRAMYGGGRYDNLLTLFGEQPIPTVGFAIGDVVMRDFLETHNLLPKYIPATKVMIAVVDEPAILNAHRLAQTLRMRGISVAVNTSLRKLGDQFASAEKLSIPKVIVLGSGDTDGTYSLKTLGEKEAPKHTLEELVTALA
ncbi:MAG: histidyl-tRNA synthetase, histidyl-tRNA synthetase [Candidatus Parcubacteria bacterium]